jgi:glycosyltransferase involved in cell wall biosynthesis
MPNQVEEINAPVAKECGIRQCWHLIASEYPPQMGGVSDYTHSLAAGLTGQGDEVHVWCPPCDTKLAETNGAMVHRELGAFSPADLRHVGNSLDRFPAPRRILVQWVPHGYGYRTMNVGFCWWLWKRAVRSRDDVELMVHEPNLPFRAGAWRQNAAALVHRLMMVLLLHAANRVWLSIPGWERRLRPYTLGRRLQFQWLPIPSNVPTLDDLAGAQEVRRRYAGDNRVLIGHFGTYGTPVTDLLKPIVLALARDSADQMILLMGQRSEQFRQELVQIDPRLGNLVQATGTLPAAQLSCHLAACDLLIQPYPDGVSTRRTSVMAGLSHGKPAVTTTGEFTEPLWSETGAVVLAPAGDTDAFVNGVRRFRADASERERAGQLARALYMERFDLTHTIVALREAATTKVRR